MGRGGPLTKEEQLQQAAAKGDAEAAFELSNWYRTGVQIEGEHIGQSSTLADRYLERAVELGHHTARRNRRRDAIQGCFGFLILTPALCGILIGLGIVGFQVYSWLKTGEWIPMPIYAGASYLGIDEPINAFLGQMEWIGVRKVLIEFYFEWPLLLFVIVLGITLSYTIHAIREDSKH